MLIKIRLATLADIPRLRELIRDSVSGLSDQHYSPEQIASALAHVFGVDTQLILDGTYFVAETDAEIAGCGGWSKRKTLFGGDQTKSDQAEPLLDAESEAARIRAFYVHPKRARQGVGTRILKACETAAAAAGFARVELAATLPGVPLYSASGYAKLGQVDIPLPDGLTLPVVRMEKRLLPPNIRPLIRADQQFLWEMLYQSLYVPKGAQPFQRSILDQPDIAKYVRDWGRKTDCGFVAVDQAGLPVGAVWLRLLIGSEKGFGYVDERTPEIGMAVLPAYRGQGIGTSLLARLIEFAAGNYEQICLSVAAENPALRLYERFAFEVVARSGCTITMRRQMN
jgi:ribosomal protein S18 acetylase RimI-like enzyme